MTEKSIRIVIDPSGAQAGGRVVRRELADIGRGAQSAERSTDRFGRQASRSFRQVGDSATIAGKSVGVFTRALSGLAAAAAAAFSFGQAIQSARQFSSALAEVSTLLPLTDRQLNSLGERARSFGRQFGTDATLQLKGFYQAISAGASSVGEASAILATANKLAIGGVTTVETAVDGLTTAVNAYAASGLTAADAADAMFVGIRAGKTTAGELSSALGAAVPIASSLGVSFDQLIAATAALTTQGQSTAMAITGIRASLTQIAKPTKQASDLAKQLGIEFNAAALKSKGYAEFMKDVIAKTGGSSEKLAELFGSVEALNAVMSFAGGGGKKFADILEQMGEKAGSADAAYKKMADSLSQRWNVIMSQAADLVLAAGNAILSVLVPAIETLIANSQEIATTLAIVATGMSLAFGPAILSAMAAGFAAFSSTVVAGISAITAAMAANPVGALIIAITAATAAAYVFRDKIKEAIGIDVVAVFSDVGNWLVRAMATAYENITFVWNNFPDVMAEVGRNAGNALISATEQAINYAIDAIKQFYRTINPLAKLADMSGNSTLSNMLGTGLLGGGVNLPRITGGNSKAYNAAIREHMSTLKRIQGSTFFEAGAPGQMGGESSAQAIKAIEEATRSATGALGEAGEAGKTAGGAIKDAAKKGEDAWKGLRKQTDKTLEQMRVAANKLGQSIGGIFRGMLDGTLTWKDAALSALKSVLSYMNQMAGGKLFGGGLLQGLVGGFLGISGFAKGGIVDKPTFFQHSGGMGVAGEAGREAIMPLKRGSNGALGVQVVNDNRPARQEVVHRVEVTGVFVDDGGVVRGIARGETAKGMAKSAEAMPLVSQQTARNRDLRRIAPTRRLVG